MVEPTLASLPNLFLKGIFDGLFVLWPIWLMIAVIGIGIVVFEAKKKNKKYSSINKIQSDRGLLNNLRRLTPSEFEDYIAHLFNKLGFTTEKVGGAYDGGIDVVAIKDNIKHYIQCKKFITSQVSVGDIRDFYGSLVDHIANGKGYFITTNKFTLEAEKFAEDKPIELIDGYRLIEYIKTTHSEDYIIPTKTDDPGKCPQCGASLIKRTGKYGNFYGCQNYPKCKFTKK